MRAGQGRRLDPPSAGDDRRARLRARSGRVAERGDAGVRLGPPGSPLRRCSAPTPWPKPSGGFSGASSRDRCPGTGTSAIWSVTTCCRPPSARCGRRRSSRRRWPTATRESSSACAWWARAALRDFHAPLCARPTSAEPGSQRAQWRPSWSIDRADKNSLVLARRFDDPSWRAAFAGRLALKLQADERVGTAGRARSPRSARRVVRPRAPARPLGVRDPHPASVGSRHAPARDPA